MRKSYHISLILFILILGFQSCKDESEPLPKLVAAYNMTPDAGLTTTIFRFDVAGATDLGDNNNPVFVRFDWDADGIWDIQHSSLPVYEHRYFIKGSYNAILEVSRVSGETDTITRNIIVEQGYSPPQIVLIIEPDSAHLLTEFTFDGSLTHDDEDSIETLLFRWDFEGDNEWDTDFQSNPIIVHNYTEPMNYTVYMEVKDTMDLISKVEGSVIVNLSDHHIKPIATYYCGHCTLEEEFIFDASESYIEGEPDARLLYSWDTNYDGKWEIDESESPVFSCYFEKAKKYPVVLRITAPNGLIMDTILRVDVHSKNTPPYGQLTIGCDIGNPQTQFHFHSRRSWDRDESMMTLRIRWDLDNDGQWDTELNDQTDVYKQFDEPGQHDIRMSIIDSGDKDTVCLGSVMVYEGNHETGLLIDKRPTFTEEYGIVKIGNQWWMQENFNSSFVTKEYNIIAQCYQNDQENCDRYGGLYSFGDMRISEICPKGWRVPKLKDWEALMEELEDNHIGKLMLGGSSEFHMQTGGYVDHSRKFTGKGTSTHFWVRDLTHNRVPQGWYFNPGRGINQNVFVGKSYKFYVRCIKN